MNLPSRLAVPGITGRLHGLPRFRIGVRTPFWNPLPLPLMNFRCRLESPATAAGRLIASAALMRFLPLQHMRIWFDPDEPAPASGFLDPLAVSVKPASPVSFNRQRSGLALRRFSPDLRRQALSREPQPSCHFRRSLPKQPNLLVASRHSPQHRSVQAKDLARCLGKPALGLAVLGV